MLKMVLIVALPLVCICMDIQYIPKFYTLHTLDILYNCVSQVKDGT